MIQIPFTTTPQSWKNARAAHLAYLKRMEHLSSYNKGSKELDSTSPLDQRVKQPSHYTSGKIECWDYLQDNMPPEAFIGGLEWNIKKYLHRWRYKDNPTEDLKKAQVYLNKLIQFLERKEDVPTSSSSPDS